ncbi:MAG: MscL family protein [Candidatus Paceibacterota bacterium]
MIVKGFIEFIRTRGVIGFAIGFIVGKAVSDLVASFVNDIINPVIGLLLGSFKNLTDLSFYIFSAELKYGNFISVFINFLVIAFITYLIFKVLKLERLDMPKN